MNPEMPKWRIGWFSLWLTTLTAVVGQGSRSDYERAQSLEQRTANRVYRSEVKPNWAPGSSWFWYGVNTSSNSHSYFKVNPVSGTRSPLFDSERLYSLLAKATGHTNGTGAAFLASVDYDWENARLHFRNEGGGWTYSIREDQLTKDITPEVSTLKPLPTSGGLLHTRRTGESTQLTFVNRRGGSAEVFWIDPEGRRRSYGRVTEGTEKTLSTYAGHVWEVVGPDGTSWGFFAAGEGANRAVLDATPLPETPQPEAHPDAPARHSSPDGRWAMEIVNHNILLTGTNGTREVLTTDGTVDDAYTDTIAWSPDSLHAALLRTRPAQSHEVHWVESSPPDQLEPRLHHQDYLKPGDRVAIPRPYWVDVASRRVTPVATNLCPNPYELGELRWFPDSSRFTFEYNQRGHQVYRVLAVDVANGRVEPVIEETSPTFIDYSGKHFLYWNDRDHTAFWMSERDGWNHLWRYDSSTGKVLNQVTRGPWVVRSIVEIVSETRQVWFMASGLRAGEDPYHQHLCRVQWDGGGFVQLTEGDGTHQVEFSPDHRFFVNHWSRVDHSPVTELRRADTGQRVMELERAETGDLLASGWSLPERFAAKGRDGTTDIWGILIKPSNFSPDRHYPVVEEVYAGPQDAYVPKAFGREVRLHALAELGFIVVQVDGMGTSCRSKAFHDVCWKNLADAGFADRIAWIRAAASTRPWMDLSRVGTYGGSAGGQNAMRALIDHPDFYKVAVADCGCHDNRMDKIWWNEQWMGWPVGPEYEASSNAVQAHKLKGKLLLMVGELDTNVDPSSTFQVVNALEKADRDFEFLVITGTGHGSAETPYGNRRRMDFLVRNLLGREPRWD